MWLNFKIKLNNFLLFNSSLFLATRNFIFSFFFVKPPVIENIPIIINNRNRLTYMIKLINRLKEMNYNNIIILDNASTYPPLLEFYKKTDCEVIFLGENLGYNSLEKIPLYLKLRKNYFVYTDPDVIPIENCPKDFMKLFYQKLKKYPLLQKVGFSLKIDDLPGHYGQKDDVLKWEGQFYNSKIDDVLFNARIDTTFALHRPYARISTKGRYKMARTAYPYQARHLPWYIDTTNISEEEKYYIDHVEIGTHWSKGLSFKKGKILRRLLQFILPYSLKIKWKFIN